MKQIPNNFRRLKNNEKLRNRDLCKNGEYIHEVGHHAWDSMPKAWSGYTFFRKRVRDVTPAITIRIPRPVTPKTTAPKIPIVQFQYPHVGIGIISRVVHVISYDHKYLTGLERIRGENGVGDYTPRYQFKKFKTNRIVGTVHLISFKPKQ